jgi:hypothetical protein
MNQWRKLQARQGSGVVVSVSDNLVEQDPQLLLTLLDVGEVVMLVVVVATTESV